jgi:hypothetical protein
LRCPLRRMRKRYLRAGLLLTMRALRRSRRYLCAATLPKMRVAGDAAERAMLESKAGADEGVEGVVESSTMRATGDATEGMARLNAAVVACGAGAMDVDKSVSGVIGLFSRVGTREVSPVSSVETVAGILWLPKTV